MAIDLKNKRILVTGGNGFLGKHIVRNLVEKRGVPRENIAMPHSAEFDLRKQEDAAKILQGQDIVIHLAALSVGLGSNIGPATVFYSNAMMGLNLIEAAQKSGVEKFVSIGSANEYPADAPMPLKEDDLWKGLPDSHLLPYSMAKKIMALEAQLYRKEYGFNAIHLIMTSMYGPGFDPDNTLLVPTLIRQIEKAKKENQPHIVGWGTGLATRDFLYVEDAAEGIIKATEKYDKPEPVNIATGWEIPVKELMETLCRLLDFKGTIEWDASKPEGQRRYVLDVSRAEKEFGFRARTKLAEGLEKTVAAHRS